MNDNCFPPFAGFYTRETFWNFLPFPENIAKKTKIYEMRTGLKCSSFLLFTTCISKHWVLFSSFPQVHIGIVCLPRKETQRWFFFRPVICRSQSGHRICSNQNNMANPLCVFQVITQWLQNSDWLQAIISLSGQHNLHFADLLRNNSRVIM